MPALTAKGRIQKGKNLENHVCEKLKEYGLDEQARRSYGSGNSNGIKADIDTRATILGLAFGAEYFGPAECGVTQAVRQARAVDLCHVVGF